MFVGIFKQIAETILEKYAEMIVEEIAEKMPGKFSNK